MTQTHGADATMRRRAFDGLRATLFALFPYRNIDLSSTGYQPTGDAAARRRGVAQIRSWWQANRSR